MSIRKKDLLELELMSYTDIAYEIIKEDNKKYNTPKLFKEGERNKMNKIKVF